MAETKRLICDGISVSDSSMFFEFSLYFSNGEAIPVGVLSDSIKGMDVLLRESSGALLDLFGIDEKAKANILVNTVTQGSKLYNFVWEVLLGNEKETAETAAKLHERLGINKMLESRHIQNVAIAAIIAYAIVNVAKLYMPEEQGKPLIDAANSVIINAGRDLQIPSEELYGILQEGVRNKRVAGKAAVQALTPSKLRASTHVKIGGEDGIPIPQTIINSLPNASTIDTSEPEKGVDINNVEVTVVACDIQKQDAGWAVIIPKEYPFGGRRIKAVLSDEVHTTDAMYKQTIKVNLTVLFNETTKKPTHALIRSMVK